MELISVIVPVYKVEAYLDRCVQSIADQTYSDLEIILVDDGSPDNCGAMCDQWAERDSRIKVIHKKNGGLSDARNAGLAVATGEYIAFVDSDDWVHPEYAAKLHEAIKAHDAQISACDFLVTEEFAASIDAVTTESTCHTSAQAIESLLGNTRFRAVAWNKLYHRSLLEGETYPVGRYHEDEFFTYRIMDKTRRLAYVDAPLYFYFQRPGSIMSSVSIRHLDALDAHLERLGMVCDRYPKYYVSEKVNLCISCVSQYRTALKQHAESLREYKKRIQRCRRQVKFTFREFLDQPVKWKIYIIMSRYALSPFSVLLNLRSRGVANE